MGLKNRYGTAHKISRPTQSGLSFAEPDTFHFKDESMFETALVEQHEAVEYVPAETVEGIDLDGRVDGRDWRFTKSAFADLCHFSKAPVAFIKRYLQNHETEGIDLIRNLLSYEFSQGQAKNLVLDNRDGLIYGIVGDQTYAPYSNRELFDMTISSMRGLHLTNGWIQGASMRFTTVSDRDIDIGPITPGKDDILNAGMNVHNTIHGDARAEIASYIERLICTNGMVGQDSIMSERVRHVGNVEDNVIAAVSRVSSKAEGMVPMMRRAKARMLTPQGVETVRGFLQAESVNLDKEVTRRAMNEATNEGRAPEEVTLWNFTNGLTEFARDTVSMARRASLEGTSFNFLREMDHKLAA